MEGRIRLGVLARSGPRYRTPATQWIVQGCVGLRAGIRAVANRNICNFNGNQIPILHFSSPYLIMAAKVYSFY